MRFGNAFTSYVVETVKIKCSRSLEAISLSKFQASMSLHYISLLPNTWTCIIDPTKKEIYSIYSGLPPISSEIAQRRARFAGHCMRAQDQLISTILPLRFQQTGRGRRPLTFPDIVARDVKMTVEDMRVAMLDRAVWRCHVHGVSMDAID